MKVRTLAVLFAGLGPLHPLHTSLTQLTYRAADRAVEISIRAFAEDFHAAVARRPGPQSVQAGEMSDSAAFSYVAAAITLLDRDGRSLPLKWCGLKRIGDLVWLCLEASVPGGLGGLQVSNRVFFDLFADQINIVQASYAGRRESLLFTQGDHAKRLP